MGTLNAATTTGPGTAIDLITARLNIRMTTSVTGAPAACVVNLEGSVDGTTWKPLATANHMTVSNALPGSGPVTDVVISNGHAVRYARGNLVTLTPGANPTPTVSAAIQPLP